MVHKNLIPKYQILSSFQGLLGIGRVRSAVA